MLLEVKRFHRRARSVLTQASDELTLGEFLRAGRLLRLLHPHFMVPMVSCVWSTSQQAALGYPARYLFSFLDNHGMLAVTGSPEWRTVVGGSRTYVEKAVKGLTSVRLRHPGTQRPPPRRPGGGPRRRRQAPDFSRVVIATHADTALGCWPIRRTASARCWAPSATPDNHTGCTPTTDCSRRARRPGVVELPDAVLHDDPDRVVVSYDMNRLQQLVTTTPYLVTLNARSDRPRPGRGRMDYEHPIYTLGPSPRNGACPSSTRDARPSPARTTAGASTRTAAGPASPRRGRWGCSGELDRPGCCPYRPAHALSAERPLTHRFRYAAALARRSRPTCPRRRGLRWLARFDAADHLGAQDHLDARRRPRPARDQRPST